MRRTCRNPVRPKAGPSFPKSPDRPVCGGGSRRPQQGQFAAALDYVAQLHGGKAQGSQQKAQAAQALECGKICVLHGQKSGQALGGGFGGESVIAQSAFQNCLHCLRFVGRSFESKRNDIRRLGENILARPLRPAADRLEKCCCPTGRPLADGFFRRGHRRYQKFRPALATN